MTRPPHRYPALTGLVALGGAVGSVTRYGVALALPDAARTGGWPLATLTVNVVGAFFLGWLLEALGRRGPETPRLRRLRLGIGTGVLGGFTTYSSLALETERLLAGGATGAALGYVAVTLVVGTAACVTGIALGARRPGARRSNAGRSRARRP